MNDTSSLYVGTVMHRRLRPRRHHFTYRAFWLLIDLDDIDTFRHRLRLFSHNRANLFSLQDRDHGDGSATPLRLQFEQQLARAGIDIAGGRLRLLCMPRTCGHCFNPLSVVFCDDRSGRLAAIIYQVHNTFGERHSYVIPASGGDTANQHCTKTFYVSPFLDMNLDYDFRVSGPGERIGVGITARGPDGPVLVAVLAGRRQPLTDASLARAFLRIPAITLKVVCAIHWEALKLWAKRIAIRQRPQVPQTAAGAAPTSIQSE